MVRKSVISIYNTSTANSYYVAADVSLANTGTHIVWGMDPGKRKNTEIDFQTICLICWPYQVKFRLDKYRNIENHLLTISYNNLPVT